MKNVQSTQHGGVWLAAVMSFVLLAAVLAHREVQAAAVTSGVLTPQDMSVDECRSRMMANAKTLAENRTITAEDAVFPTDEVFASLSPSEKKSVGQGVGRVYDRVMSTNGCEAAELQWCVMALSCLCQDIDEDTATVINRIFESPVHRVMTLEKLAQLETMMRTVYQKTVTGVDVSPNEFDRTEYKKALIRRRLSLMRGHAQ